MSGQFLDIGSAVNSGAAWVGRSPVLGSAFGNPFLAALVLTVLVAIVAMATFHYTVTSSNLKKSLKAGFYTYLVALAVMYLHHHIMTSRLQESGEVASVRQFFGGLDLRGGGGNSAAFDVRGALASGGALAGAPATDSGYSPAAGAPPGIRLDNVRQGGPEEFQIHNVPVEGRAVV